LPCHSPLDPQDILRVSHQISDDKNLESNVHVMTTLGSVQGMHNCWASSAKVEKVSATYSNLNGKQYGA
jgi:hypothetical protein